jgi:hypothetical protein
MVGAAEVIGTHLQGVVFPAGLDAESFSTGVLAALSHSLRALLAERGLTAAAPLADELMAEVPTAVAPLADEMPMHLAAEQTAAAPADRYERLARAATGAPGLSNRRIAQKRRSAKWHPAISLDPQTCANFYMGIWRRGELGRLAQSLSVRSWVRRRSSSG